MLVPTAHGAMYEVYDTKVTAKTSTIKELSVKVNKSTVKIHYRAPVSKSYTIVFAYDGTFNNTAMAYNGHGRMWSNDKQTDITLTGETWYVKSGLSLGDATYSYYNSHIGVKRNNFPWYRRYWNISNSNAPQLQFEGLSAMDMTTGRMNSSTGIVRGYNIHPARCAKCPNAEQGLASVVHQTPYTEDDVRTRWEKDSSIWECLYPVTDTQWMLSPAHFHGTYSTRYNKKLSTTVLGSFPQMRELVNARVPAK